MPPLHPDVVPRLDLEYVQYFNANLVDKPQLHELPWDPNVRKLPAVAGASQKLAVGREKDVDLANCKARIFFPVDPASEPNTIWPVFIFFHGGGWTLGNMDSENHFSAMMCLRAKCIVVSVDYRLAPEDPYPAGVEDAVDSFKWVLQNPKDYNMDTSRIAVGGSSSGANLAAVLSFKAVEMNLPVQPMFQLLIVPVVDNLASVDGHPYPSWYENRNTPQLNHGRMLWFRDMYMPQQGDRAKWDASPMFAPEDWFTKVADAWIGVGELDILRDEGIAYGEKLKKAGRKVEIKVYEKAPHPIMAMDGVLKVGRLLISDAAEALRKAFWP